jgi:aspartyl aminopeptidase
VGLDSSLIGGYGQDDRICAYTSLEALFGVKKSEFTCVALFMDKEEIGSDGATGAKSQFFESFVLDLLELSGENPTTHSLRKTLIKTRAISADVTGALDPDYQEVHEKRNAARLGYGPCVNKYTGSRGKYGASDASAEYLGWLRQVFSSNNIIWQAAELGKVDEGGGGTVAKDFAQRGMEIVDCGPALLDVHSPFEISSKADLYMTTQAYQAFYTATHGGG